MPIRKELKKNGEISDKCQITSYLSTIMTKLIVTRSWKFDHPPFLLSEIVTNEHQKVD